MWNKITPPVLGLDTNLALAIAGGMVLVGLAMLLWGRKVHWAFVILAGAGAGVLFLTPVVQKCTGLELRPAQIMAGISAAGSAEKAINPPAVAISHGADFTKWDLVRIPTAPEKAESLNVAACGAILMYLSSEK